MKCGRNILLIAMVLGSLLGASGADTAGVDTEISPPEVGLITRLRRQQEAKKRQAEYDVKVAIPDIDAAERELEGLNNTVSNAMHMAERSKQAEESSPGVFQSIVTAAVLLGVGIFFFRKVAPRIGFLYNVSEQEADVASINLAEEKSFSEFVTAFKVGPRRRRSSENAGASVASESLSVGETRLAVPGPLKMFFDSAPKAVAIMRGLIQEITRAAEQAVRQKLLTDLGEKVHGLKCSAGLPEVLPVWQLAAALEGLVRQLSDKDRNVTPSSLRTVASAVDLLEALSVEGVRSDLMSNPPIRLLAVDDDSLSRHAVSFALKKALNKPDLAENGEAALALVSQIKYDAIFLDVQMPGMNGFEACSKIHTTELNRATPVVFVTCQSDFDARAKSTLSGGADLIGKPFLTFEITVKALTLALRGRLNPKLAATSLTKSVLNSKEIPKSSAENETSLVIEKDAVVQGPALRSLASEGLLAKDAAFGEGSSSIRKSREQRRRDRRRKAQATRQNKKGHKLQLERPTGSSKKNENANAEGSSPVVPLGDSLNLSSDMVANAFLTHAPANIETLQNRLELICQASDDETRQERVVELYLAVHSLASEASLAKLHTILQLSSAIEVLLKKLLEEPSGSIIASLSVLANALELLHDFCDAKLASNLAEQPIHVLVVADAPLARMNLQDAIQVPGAEARSAEISEAFKLAAEKQFDVIFLDVQTLNADTLAVCSKLREHSKVKTPIVFVSDQANSGDLLESILSDGDRLLQRSCSPAEASLAAIASALGGRFEQLIPAGELDGNAPIEELATAAK